MKLLIVIFLTPLFCSSQVDWGKVGSDFNNSINSAAQSREAYKEKLNRLVRETKSSIRYEYFQSDFNGLNNIFLKAQERSIQDIEKYDRLLKSGILDHRCFENLILSVGSSFRGIRNSLNNCDKSLKYEIESFNYNERETKKRSLYSRLNSFINNQNIDSKTYSNKRGRRTYVSEYTLMIGNMSAIQFNIQFNNKIN